MSDPFLNLEQLSLGYGASLAVPSLDLAMAEGELVALLGPSGCGKTTTMRAIAGLLAPRSGRITLAGRDITRVSANQREVGLVFQSYALFPHLSVFENVAFGLRTAQGGGRRDAASRRRGHRDGGPGRLRAAPSPASCRWTAAARGAGAVGGGAATPAAAGRAAVKPGRVCASRCAANCSACSDLGVTMMYVTHDQSGGPGLADRVVVMREGRIAQQGSPVNIYERPRTAFVARFVGFENVFAATLPGRLQPWLDGQPGLAWRPRGVVLGQGPHDGQVLGASYLGESVEVLLQTDAGPLKAQVAPDGPRCVAGENLKFDLPMSSAVALES
jgi:putative spermidine/putrescine transport system ATP-binding protein